MNPTTVENDRRDNGALTSVAAVACVIACLIVSPLAGIGAGAAVAAIGMALRRRLPTIKELLIVFAALAAAAALVTVLTDWSDFKEGIAEGFRRIRPR